MLSSAKNSLYKILKKEQVSEKEDILKTYGGDWLKMYLSSPSMVIFPKSHQDIENIIHWALEFNIKLVPSGGRTGLSGSAVAEKKEVILSFDKMNRILNFNEIEHSLNVEPGVVTQTVRDFAEKKGFYFPISFSAVGSSQIGGNISTNAGGVHVIQYGVFRNWVSGITVVTGGGKTLNLGKSLVKNSAGYDLMNLFIGSEGTLAIITRATLKLTQIPPERAVFFLSVPDLSSLMKVYYSLRTQICLRAFEMMTSSAVKYLQKNSSLDFPLKEKADYYVLIEYNKSEEEKALSVFEKGLEKSWILDGVVSESPRQAQQLWAFRENISESIAPYSPYKNDVSVRISLLPEFLSEVNKVLKEQYPDFDLVMFGHVGDGNVHINILKPSDMDKENFLEKCAQADRALFSVVQKFEGSISAEHGVGLLKKAHLSYSLSSEEIQYMKEIKKIFDPKGILNPGKIFD